MIRIGDQLIPDQPDEETELGHEDEAWIDWATGPLAAAGVAMEVDPRLGHMSWDERPITNMEMMALRYGKNYGWHVVIERHRTELLEFSIHHLEENS